MSRRVEIELKVQAGHLRHLQVRDQAIRHPFRQRGKELRRGDVRSQTE